MTDREQTRRDARKRRFKSTPSHIYQRLLWGEVTSERYVAVIKRASRMRLSG